MNSNPTLVGKGKATLEHGSVQEESAAPALHPVGNPPSTIHAGLSQVLPGWQPRADQPAQVRNEYTIGILAGEGIGPELMAGVAEVLDAVARHAPFSFDIRYGGLIGKSAEQAHGRALTPQVIEWCETLFADQGAILCGPGGGRFVYEMRARFQLFCKLTPIRPYPALRDTGVIRPEALANVDLVVVRENASGLYFGECNRHSDAAGVDRVTHTFGYRTDEVERIIAASINLARLRRGRLSLVVKPGGVPAVSQLWIDVFNELVSGAGISSDIIEVDNASYQIIAAAAGFDVIVAPNLFGDILSDAAALLLGSRGLSFSGNFAANGVATYQTGHGAAHDISGRDTANPVGQILSTAMMLRESFGLGHAADAIEAAIGQTLAAGIRTADIAAPGCRVVGTREMVRRIVAAIEQELPELEHAG